MHDVLLGGSGLSVGLTGLAGFADLALIIVCVLLADRRDPLPLLVSRLGEQTADILQGRKNGRTYGSLYIVD